MPSLLPGYEYDIFVSYRQKDNKGDKWVTHFVNALKNELEATFKDEVSVYFDENPHDGLLENHEVNKSLESKLKCVVFIPILSQTYCDPKSFAWEHEFCAFNRIAKEDSLGKDIQLLNGNVASRILPVRIHDLEPEDLQLIENEIGGKLRAIDFVFRSPGVIRPLREQEDALHPNLNKTVYRDQINKVARAIKEIIQAAGASKSSVKKSSEPMTPVAPKPGRNRLAAIPFILMVLAGLTYFTWTSRPSKTDRPTVAVLEFEDMSPNKDQEWFSAGMSEEILNSLARLKKLSVTARTTSLSFKGKLSTVLDIGRRLGVDNVVEGSVKKVEDQIRVTVRLIRVKDEVSLWQDEYNRPANDLLNVQLDIAEKIAKALFRELTEADRAKLIDPERPSNAQAKEHFMRGIWLFLKWDVTQREEDFRDCKAEFTMAIKQDSLYAEPYAYLGLLEQNSGGDNEKVRKLINLAYRLRPDGLMVLRAKSFYYFYQQKDPELDSAFYYLRKAYAMDPDNPLVNKTAYQFYETLGLHDLACMYAKKAVDGDSLSQFHLNILALYQWRHGLNGEAIKTLKRSFLLDSSNIMVNFAMSFPAMELRNTKTLTQCASRARKVESERSRMYANVIEGLALASQGKRNLSLKLLQNAEDSVYAFYALKDYPSMLSVLIKRKPLSYDQLTHQSIFAPLKEEPEFKELLRKEKIHADELRKKYEKLE